MAPMFLVLLLGISATLALEQRQNLTFPLAISTWSFVEAVRSARRALESGRSAVDAVVEGCSTCERLQCDGSVGYGGSPDESGETTLDAMVMDGVWYVSSRSIPGILWFSREILQTTMNAGAVGSLRFVRDAAIAAKLVLLHTEHTLLVGDQASKFAISMGLQGPVNLSTDESLGKTRSWLGNSCQPNFWKDVVPDSKLSCGPYQTSPPSPPLEAKLGCGGDSTSLSRGISSHNHDTISMAAIDKEGNIAVGTSTNGATHKIPGRVGDGPIVGAGAYADSEVGACGATGDGDVMMRFLPCYQVVESMRRGMTPQQAADDAIARIRRKYPDFVGALFAINRQLEHASACHGWTFRYSVWSKGMDDVEVITVLPSD
ncbi:probable isoaspartyl peptidase/L-asparaginase 3 isoform X1 [Selaginella moellendorffii]|uniref:probable isoaspartyl peptidase/L-asparaginase 3 isoform X1 n=1 Tax=Selaginella moellendorffii TaxID=88036 RepID=UPI000D1C55E1|nr:probable isoaspartyl peptidase/L-asparaginase 3 isoform X1 [Selaginella moellendorffii]|eukprot:XP_024531092.1 probable isoaspartyl peptidase/L-asparaginase 3 isoform X1 [Selaginella moellendorffii]